MTAYLPSSVAVIGSLAAVLAATVIVGYLLNRHGDRPALRFAAWMWMVLTAVLVERLCGDEPAGFRMLAIVATVLYGMKGVVAVESRLDGKPPLSPLRWLVFCLLWFGMRPAVFHNLFGTARDDAASQLASGLLRVAVGAVFIAAAVSIAPETLAREPSTLAALALLMIGVSLTVHFGLFDALAGTWRSLGADCPKLFRAPLQSRSLTEFWSRRWNVAFSEMAALAVFRPTKSAIGSTGARTAAFLFSGLLHELAISVPVKAGYGLPFCYFLLHAVAMQLEAAPFIRRALQARVLAHLWTAVWVLLPLPLLFHWPFCAGVLLPLLQPRS